METTKQTPSECKHYRKGYCLCGQILRVFDEALKTPCEIANNPEVYCLNYQPKKKLYGK